MAILTSALSVIEGGSLTFTLSFDTPAETATTYRWRIRPEGHNEAALSDFASSVGFIDFAPGESEKTFTITANVDTANAFGDRTFGMTIDTSSGDPVTTSDIADMGTGTVTLQNNDGQAIFTIESDGETGVPAVGDILTATRGDDPDPDGDGTFTYQWFVVGGGDIAGAIDQTYTITDPGQIIGVRVSYTDGGGFDETITTQLNVASVLINPSEYAVVQISDGNGKDNLHLHNTSADEIIQGGNKRDILFSRGGDDIFIGGYGKDWIILNKDGEGAETVVYRFSSDGTDGWTAIDGTDIIHRFDRGVDKLVLVDVADTPIDLATFLQSETEFEVALNLGRDGKVLRGIIITFPEAGLPDGPGNGGGESGNKLAINFKVDVTIFDEDGSTTDEGAQLVGENGAHYDANTGQLTDFALLPNYFKVAGEAFDGLRVIEASELGIDITDVNDMAATYIIDDSDSGDAEHITDPTNLAEGSILYARILTDDPNGDGEASYQWKRNGADIDGGTESSYVVTAADRLRSLTVTVTYIDGDGTEESVTSDAVDIPAENDGVAIFSIASDGDVNNPVIGDELTVNLDIADPDGWLDGILPAFTYQWFVVGGANIVGATDQTYTITEVGQIIGVRVNYLDGHGFEETSTAELNKISILFDRLEYTVVQDEFPPEAANIVSGTSADEIIQGGNRDDTITTGGGDDIVIGGYGRDVINLDDGAETIIYRFSSERVTVSEVSRTGWIATDGADVVDNFDRGTDKIVFVDVADTPIDLAGFLTRGDSFEFRLEFNDPNDANVLTGVLFNFVGRGLPDSNSPGTTTVDDEHHGRNFRINFKEEDRVTIFNSDGTETTDPTTTDEGAELIGENGAHYDAETKQLTDFALLPNYFRAAGEDFDDELQVITPEELGVTIVDAGVDVGDATYVIDDVADGLAEHITDTTNLAEGSMLYARVFSRDPDGDGNGDASYQWKRGGGDIVGATSASYAVTAADLGRILTVTVSYTDGGGTAERVTSATVDIPAAPANNNQATFMITSDGDINNPLIGDELTVTRDTADPQGDGTFSYQWFVVGGADIVGATAETYMITNFDQIIAVRVSYTDGNAVDEVVTTELSVASFYPVIQGEFPAERNPSLRGTSADELIQGGNKDDTIFTEGGNDVVIGGYGSDLIILNRSEDSEGAETVIYRFSSDGTDGWTAIDGSDGIHGFDRGVDKLVLVDVADTPIDVATFLQSEDEFEVALSLGRDGKVLRGIVITFPEAGLPDGPGNGGESSGNQLVINFRSSVTIFDEDGSTTDEGAQLVGENGVHYDANTDQPNTRPQLTDFALLPNYFKVAGEAFDDGLQVIEMSELGFDIF